MRFGYTNPYATDSVGTTSRAKKSYSQFGGSAKNPYSQLGKSAAGILDILANSKSIEHGGYLDASQKMANIDRTHAQTANANANTSKIMQALENAQQAHSVTGEDLVGMMNGTDNPELNRANTVVSVNQMSGGKAGFDDIMSVLQSAGGHQDYINDNVPLNMRPVMQNYLGEEGQGDDLQGAIAAVLAEQRNARKRGSGTHGGTPPDLNDPFTVGNVLSKTDALAYWHAILKDKKLPPDALEAAMKNASQMKDDEIMALIEQVSAESLYPLEGGTPGQVGAGVRDIINQFRAVKPPPSTNGDYSSLWR